MIKESCNGIGQETQLAKPNQKEYSQVLPLLDEYFNAKNLRDCWICSRDIDDQIICYLIGQEAQLATHNSDVFRGF